MAKLLKQIVIFCVFTAAIYGVFALVTAGKPALNTAALTGSNVDELSEEISSGWASLSGWDSDLYNRQMTMVAQSYNSNLINDDARKSLYDRVNKEAYTKAVLAMNAQFKRTDADESILSINDDGLMTIASREPGIERIPEVAEVERVYRLYCRIKQFNKRSFATTPRFNGNDGSWAPSFDAVESNAMSTHNDLISNPDFKSRLSHINEMKKIHETESKLDKARNDYYNDLARQIENYFDSALQAADPETDERKDLRVKFQTVRAGVFNETGGRHSINSRLKNFLDRL